MSEPYILAALEPAAQVPNVEDMLAVVGAARAEADTIREQARAEGLAQGRAEGAAAAREEARAQLVPAMQALATAAQSIAETRDEVADRVERAAVELALELAEKVVGTALEVQPERVLEAVRSALRCLVARERIQVLVHPDDLALVRDAMAEMTGELDGVDHVEVLEERRLSRGGAIVRTADAEIDAGVRTKLERAREILTAEMGRA